ncbi:exodeoxyribonuclease-3 [Flavobacterium flevense]|uniref:Exodeoxyribonuclease III n=1 Tax=Flavobacterium flevense TaxID=983 RepID=A0A4Y4ARR4_9FLAO|nr:exodeoxyribonuclease III [Flavobacterium flevense]GEC70911.1 exodeoxyribonuclease III [Flavobacterium flevense]SHL55354.1 exodeoxyribonuclease-3 [Flavobacterium flevense]
MRIVSYNVNGIRSAISKGFISWLEQSKPDVVCLQEIKATPDQLPLLDFELAGYPYHYWFPATKKGYSGVAILSKIKPNNVVYGTGIEHMDFEGRTVRVDFDDFSVMSLYLPSGTNIERLSHKFMFMDDFQNYITNLKNEIPNLIICGDYNICHEAIDIHDPIRNAKVSGFLPEERAWLDAFMKNGFVDSFRHLNKEPGHYSWWTVRVKTARTDNKGWRIDYCLVSEPLKDRIKKALILPEAKHSDHCPILVDIE